MFCHSDLATAGWTDGCRAARCLAIDDHDDVLALSEGLSLEELSGLSALLVHLGQLQRRYRFYS